MSVISLLIAAILPFIVWPLETVLPYPAMIEELAKVSAIYFTTRHLSSYNPRTTAIGVGFFFAMSESVLYLYNIAAVGGPNTFLLRLALTIPLHVITSYISARALYHGRVVAVLGLLGAVLVHAVYNLGVGSL